MVLLLVFLILGGLSHLFFIPLEPVPEENSMQGFRFEMGREKPLDQPPAYILDDEGHIHYLAYRGEDSLKYSVVNLKGEEVQEKVIPLQGRGGLAYYTPVFHSEGKITFLSVFQSKRVYEPYLLHIQDTNHVWEVMPMTLNSPADIDVWGHEDGFVTVYSVRQDSLWNLFLQKYDGKEWNEPLPISSEKRFSGLPRLEGDGQGSLHMVWKESRGNLGVFWYNAYDCNSNTFLLSEHKELGEAAIHFWHRHGQDILYEEDVGPSLEVGPGGEIYSTWTYSTYQPVFNRMESRVYLMELSPDGEKVATWKFPGSQDFSLFGNVSLSPAGHPVLFWEEYSDGRFSIHWSAFDPHLDDFTAAEPLHRLYGSHRLMATSYTEDGEMVVLWRQLQGEEDIVWAMSAAHTMGEGWHHRWNLWFFQEDPFTFLRESFFILMYSVLGAMAYVARNGLILALYALILYILQRLHILEGINFVMFLILSSAFLFFCKVQFPLLYGSPYSGDGFVLYSLFMTTVFILLLGRKHWFGGGDECTYIQYITLWLFTDAFLAFLMVAPLAFLP